MSSQTIFSQWPCANTSDNVHKSLVESRSAQFDRLLSPGIVGIMTDGGRAHEHVKVTPIGDGVARRVGARHATERFLKTFFSDAESLHASGPKKKESVLSL